MRWKASAGAVGGHSYAFAPAGRGQAAVVQVLHKVQRQDETQLSLSDISQNLFKNRIFPLV